MACSSRGDERTSIRKYCALVVFIVSAGVYFLSGGPPQLPASDFAASSYLPLSVLYEGNLELSEYADEIQQGPWNSYSLVRYRDHWVSRYPIGTPLLALPVYALFRPFLGADWSPEMIALAGKLSASLLAAFSVLLVYLTALRLAGDRTALLTATLYAFGTVTWPVSSQVLWTHAGAQLSLAAAIYLLVRDRGTRWQAAWLGLSLGWAVASRPTMLVPWFSFVVYLLLRDWRRVPRIVAFSALPGILIALYNWYYFGAPWQTGYLREPSRLVLGGNSVAHA